LNQRFPVRYLGKTGYIDRTQDRPLPERIEVGPSGASVTIPGEGKLLITGRDKKGSLWRVDLSDFFPFSVASRFYSADLDRNRIRDLILIHPTGGNGLAPSSSFFSLTFDEQGRPSPFEADGYFEDSTEGIFDLVDLNRDGRAELIHMDYDDGYWITNLYEVGGAKWQRVKGLHGHHSYPLYTRFTYRANRKIVTPAAGRRPIAPDLSNKKPRFCGRLVSYKWANANQSKNIDLVIKTEGRQKITSKQVSLYAIFTMVLDDPKERTIILLSDDEQRIKSILDEIVTKAYQIALYGEGRGGGFEPKILWVSRP
jgi:hypothetical protein